MWDSGFFAYFKQKYIPQIPFECRTDVEQEKETKAFSLTDFSAAFLILGGGLSLGILAFIIECAVGMKKNR